MKKNLTLAFLLVPFLILSIESKATYFSTLNLEGQWKFSIGDNQQWAEPSFNDANWDNISVPDRWEEQGFQGYNGIAWYRKSIVIPESFSNRDLFLEMGYIDDCDEVFVNGQKIGQSGSFPPNFSTAYNAFRKYLVPNYLIQHNKPNVIAVRVYDLQLEGGIVRGAVQLCAGEIAINPDINLNGTWKFNTGQKAGGTKTIQVPGRWEDQGYNDYDGVAVYSKTVKLTVDQLKKKWILLAGKIDDDDECYFNGQLIATTGDIESETNTEMNLESRNYFIPESALKIGDNLIEIKVKDRGGEGGIIEGNIGLISQDNFIKNWRLKRH